MNNSLKDILYKVQILAMSGSSDQKISNIEIDSRKIKKNNLFIALPGIRSDGHDYIENAISNGAIAIICNQFPDNLNKSYTYIKVKDTQKALGIISGNFFENPSKKIKLVGITGTNGKTTISSLLFQLFNKQNKKAGLISTIDIKYGKKVIKSEHTTPDINTINYFLQSIKRKMKMNGKR